MINVQRYSNLNHLKHGESDLTMKMYPQFVKDQIRHMESAISTFELKDNIAVFRWAELSMLKFFEKVRDNGGFFQDDGFVSTTAVVPKPLDDLIEVKIGVPAGMGRGAWIAPMSEFPEECEFVLQRGTIFQVVDITQEENKRWKVFIVIVGCRPKELN